MAALLVLASSSSRADDVVLAPDQIVASLSLEVNLAPDEIASPLSLAPDVWWGVSPALTVGVVHSNTSLDRIEAGASFCVRKTFLGCDALYHGGGVDVRWLAVSGAVEVAPRARLLIRDLDPWKPALTLGALGRWRAGRFAITMDPYLQLGLANRSQGNRAQLVVPVWLGVEVGSRVSLALHTGYTSELAVWDDGWHAPIGVVTSVRTTPRLALAVELGFTSAFGPQNTSKPRVALITLTLASEAPARASRGSAAAASPASRD
jgi:hypothetical protein